MSKDHPQCIVRHVAVFCVLFSVRLHQSLLTPHLFIPLDGATMSDPTVSGNSETPGLGYDEIPTQSVLAAL
jgi:hypothetical protein